MDIRVIILRTKSFVQGGQTGTASKTLTVSAKSVPQFVPDWVRNTPTWQLGVKDGSIVDMTPEPAPALVQEPAPEPPQDPPQDPPQPNGKNGGKKSDK